MRTTWTIQFLKDTFFSWRQQYLFSNEIKNMMIKLPCYALVQLCFLLHLITVVYFESSFIICCTKNSANCENSASRNWNFCRNATNLKVYFISYRAIGAFPAVELSSVHILVDYLRKKLGKACLSATLKCFLNFVGYKFDLFCIPAGLFINAY